MDRELDSAQRTCCNSRARSEHTQHTATPTCSCSQCNQSSTLTSAPWSRVPRPSEHHNAELASSKEYDESAEVVAAAAPHGLCDEDFRRLVLLTVTVGTRGRHGRHHPHRLLIPAQTRSAGTRARSSTTHRQAINTSLTQATTQLTQEGQQQTTAPKQTTAP